MDQSTTNIYLVCIVKYAYYTSEHAGTTRLSHTGINNDAAQDRMSGSNPERSWTLSSA